MKNRKKVFWIGLLIVGILCLLLLFKTYRPSEIGSRSPDTASLAPKTKGINANASSNDAAITRRLLKGVAPRYFSAADSKMEQYEEYIVEGKVVSEDGEPIQGAAIRLHQHKATPPRLEWEEPIQSALSGNTGEYRLRLVAPMHLFFTVVKSGYAQNNGEVIFERAETKRIDHYLRPAPSKVGGLVTDRNGSPLGGILIQYGPANKISDSQCSSVTVGTDRKGLFQFDRLPEGPANIFAVPTDPTKYIQDHKFVTLKAGENDDVDFILKQPVTVKLRVKDQRGHPVPQPKALVFPTDFWGDDRGEVTVAIDSDSESEKCVLSAKGYKNKVVPLVGTAQVVEVVLDDVDMFRGRVVGPSGEPLGGAKIVSAGGNTEITDADGMFSVADTTGYLGKTYMVISKVGYASAKINPEFPNKSNGAPAVVELHLERGGAGIFGIASDESGNAIRRMFIKMTNQSGGTFSKSFGNEDGRFLLGDLPAGVYELTINSHSPKAVDPAFVPREATLKSLELRDGYYYGEMRLQLEPAKRR